MNQLQPAFYNDVFSYSIVTPPKVFRIALAESHIEEPEGWTAPTGEKLTVEEARQEGERLKEDCESILAVARRLWYASEYGYSGIK